jgi:hypothetical protein
MDDGTLIAYGTPWNGKENWGSNISAPLAGVCFIERGDKNSISPLSSEESALKIMKQILIPKDSIGAIRHCQCNFIPHIAEYFDMAELGGMISPRPLVIVSGQKDRIFPIAPAREEYDRLAGSYYKEAPDKCVHFVGEEGHRYYRGAWEIFKKIR